MRTETIDVGVRHRVLWIGTEAYPLQNIARVSTAGVVFRKGAAVGRFIGITVFWIVLGVIQFVRQLSVLSRRKLWALVIETAGTSHRAVISPDKHLVNTLVREIVEAINDPAATFSHTINNIVTGDQYNQYAPNTTGRVG